MGLFDTVHAKCSCGGDVEFQSKAGECCLRDFSNDQVPLDIAADIVGDLASCNECGKQYMITSQNMPPPATINLTIIET